MWGWVGEGVDGAGAAVSSYVLVKRCVFQRVTITKNIGQKAGALAAKNAQMLSPFPLVNYKC